MTLSSIQAFVAFYITFISFFKSWEFLESKWIFIGPIIHAIFTITAFILIPLTVIISMFISGADIQNSVYSGGLHVYPIASFAIIIQFVVQILPIFLGARNKALKVQRLYQSRRGAKTAEEWDQIMDL